jgi:dTDP-4-amino-4,6-dideoxygalactose transaminase
MPAIMELAKRHGLVVIEDCAQAHGAMIEGRMTGLWGDMAAFSFYPTKNLGALGDGGAVVSNNAELIARARSLREYGWRERYISETAGMNSRLDEMQAAILRSKLCHLEAENDRRRELAGRYSDRLSETRLELPREAAGARHVYHLYVARTEARETLRDLLKSGGISTQIHYPVPIHLQPAYRSRALVGHEGLPITERVCSRILSLPMHPQLTDDQVERICELIRRWQ